MKNINTSKYAVLLITAIFIPMLIAGCASLPVPNSPSDTLVIIPTEYIQTADIGDVGRDYFLVINNGESEKLFLVDKQRISNSAVVVTSPNAKITGLRSRVAASTGIRGDATETALDIDLPYEPGKVVITDFTFRVTGESQGRVVTTRPSLEQASEETWAVVQERLMRYAVDENWDVSLILTPPVQKNAEN